MLLDPTLSETDSYVVPVAHLPAGSDTLASFVAKEKPGVLGWTVASPVEAFSFDEAMLARISAQRGLPVIYVPAAPAYLAAGIHQQPTFQIGLLIAMVGKDFSLDEWLPKDA